MMHTGAAGGECPREQDVVHAVLAGAWPNSADDTLVSHAAACGVCQDVARVAVLLREDLDSSRLDVHVPATGQVWWRAAVRARLESTHAAARPMTWMHAITAAIVLGAALAGVTAVWPKLPGLLQAVRSLSVAGLPSPEVTAAIAGGLAQSVMIGVVAAVLLLLAPLAVYFAISDD